MTQQELIQRTEDYAIRIIAMTEALPNNRKSWIIEDQIIRAACSVGANYRAACRAKSTRDFLNKLKIVEEECDETLYWLSIIIRAGLIPAEKLTLLQKEGGELLAIFVKSIGTLRAKINAPKS